VSVILKSSLAIYVSLYLVLPGCLCQVLSALGADVSESVVVQVEEPVVSGMAQGNPNAICHCDEHLAKVAEATEERGHESAAPAPVGAVFSFQAPFFFPAEAVGRLHPRGPPGSAPWTSASRSGVFLI
jgi:hypothetical protein